MRYTKFIALLATIFVAVACVNSDLGFDGNCTDTDITSDVVTVYGNIARFADCEVNTRANKTPEESYVSRMALTIFPIDEETGETGNCIHYELRDGSNLLYTVDRAEIRKKYGEEYDNVPCVMYIFANMPTLPTDGYDGSLADLLNLALSNPNLTRPDGGFPMIGSLGDADRDGKDFVFMPMIGNRMDLPKVNGTPTDYLNIPMSAIFAKISFEIAVSPDQDIDVHAPARFEMTGYEVHNLPSSVSFNEGNNKEEKQNVNGEATSVAMSGIAQGGNEGSGSIIEFDFYLPERLLTPDTSAEEYQYPLGNGVEKVTGYSNIPTENRKYAQRYKPELLGDDQKATFVRIKGKYRDHQENYHDVTYDIYLGADNYGDFNIKRNDQYFNKLNIRGITSSKDQAVNPDAISIDHRVNVERSTPLIISLRRETQLDSHFEVRPLRLRISGESVPAGAKVVVDVLNADGTENNIPTWVRLEKSGNSGDHITTGNSAGKRKYFTTNLVTGTLAANTSVELSQNELSTKSNSTVWIYVDEADIANATTTRSSRSATIRVTYTDNSGEHNDVKYYDLSQYNLHKITGESDNIYYIECFEEYLYNYDAEDSYGQLKEEGMPWGLYDVQLSNKHYSFNSSLTPNVDWAKYETTATRPYYDFYIWKHDSRVLTDAGIADTEARHEYAGQHFTKEIAENSNAGIKYRTLAEQASGAVEYCYSRNKRKSDGTVVVEWYLPSTDELEDFIIPAYNYYEEFQDNYYWTSQPAYIRNVFYYEYQSSRFSSKTISWPTVYDDNTKHARASKIVRRDGTFEPAKSGLDSVPTPSVDNRVSRGYGDYTNLGYFYVMHQYKHYYGGILSRLSEEYGPDRTGVLTGTNVTNGNYDDQFTHNDSDYYFHFGHLDNMMQEGYQPRTKSNRVRCVYKKAD